jgi:hypothetical protein
MEWMKPFFYLALVVPLVVGALAAMAGAPEPSAWGRLSAAGPLSRLMKQLAHGCCLI